MALRVRGKRAGRGFRSGRANSIGVWPVWLRRFHSGTTDIASNSSSRIMRAPSPLSPQLRCERRPARFADSGGFQAPFPRVVANRLLLSALSTAIVWRDFTYGVKSASLAQSGTWKGFGLHGPLVSSRKSWIHLRHL